MKRLGQEPVRGPIDLLEAAYEVGASREAWLQGVLDEAILGLPSNIGVSGYFLDTADGRIECVRTASGTPFRAEDVMDALKRRGPVPKLYVGKPVVNMMSEAGPRTDLGDGVLERFFSMLVPPRFPEPIRDFLGILALDSEGRGVVLSAAFPRVMTLDRGTRRRWTLLGVHVAAAARLRRTLEASAAHPAAVLRADGRVVHAEGCAKPKASREALSSRAIAIDRARGRLRRTDPDAALEMWQGLVTGRWSLVDRFESDGRRYVVAHVNEPVPARLLALTLRQRQVIGHVLLGHSSKLTGYALGISPAAVSSALKSALLKLGVGSVAKLVHRLGGIPKGGA